MRDWLERCASTASRGTRRGAGAALPKEVIEKTAAKYREALARDGLSAGEQLAHRRRVLAHSEWRQQ